jgi:hypothetical protein
MRRFQIMPELIICDEHSSYDTVPMKGQCHEIFCFRFFHESPSPKPLIITLGSIQIFFENSRRYSQVKVHHRCHIGGKLPRYQRHLRQICHRYQRHRRQIFSPVPLVLLTPVANWNNIRLQTPESELEGKNLYICFLYYPKVTK